MAVDPNATLALVQAVGTKITDILSTVKILVGGVFGLYIIILLLRVRDHRLTKKTLTQINDRLARIERKMGFSREKQEQPLRQNIQNLKRQFRRENKALQKELTKR